MPKRILVAPLDWGLGHAARCIPIIEMLLTDGFEVIVAACGRPLELLRSQFPNLRTVDLPGYGVSYPRRSSMPAKMTAQAPRLLVGAFLEHQRLKRLVHELRIDAVISDNRFGLWQRGVPCAYITHQTVVLCPRWLKWLEPWTYKLHSVVMRRYAECWIPDTTEPPGLSGSLSHLYPPPPNATFIGPLSRFDPVVRTEIQRDLLVILSGPEPQRSIFEGMVLEQLAALDISALVVQGKTELMEDRWISKRVRVASHLGRNELQAGFASSKTALARAGYSTIMDLAVIGTRAILVPTPGQTEQEYLAREFHRRGIFYSEQQERFNLERAVKEVEGYSGTAASNFSREPLRSRIHALFGENIPAPVTAPALI